jgi:hypothetical protein
MSSPNSYPEDELDLLMRGALKARVGGKEPPDRVWKQIQSGLQADQPPPLPRPRIAWSPLGLQVALTLVFFVLGGVGLRSLLEPSGHRDSVHDVSSSGTVAYVGERSASPVVTVFNDKNELRSLKADLSFRPDTPANNVAPIIVPRDVPPNVLFSEGRVLDAEPSSLLIVNEQNPIRSGPYPWYR